jgi:hypothetical protein
MGAELMPQSSFRGFTTGSSVALSVAQGAKSSSGSVTSWGETEGHMGSLSILTVAASPIVAPAGIWLEATNISGFDAAGGPGPGSTYDPSFHEITFIWTVNGSPLSPYQAPQNMVTGWNDPNKAYGKKVAFHFPDAGTYEIELWAVDRSGNTGVASTVIAVGNADSLYPGTQTVCFSNAPGESWAGEKPGCQRATTFAALQSAVDNASGPLRILFKRGQSVPVSQVARVRATSATQWLNHLGAWGSGANPVIAPLHSNFLFEIKNANPVTHFTCENIDFKGGWDATTETGYPSRSPFIFLQSTTDCHHLISRCSFDGLENVWIGCGANTNSTMIVADSVATNWRDYGAFIHDGVNSRFALIGSRFQQHIDAQNGNVNGAGKNGFYNDHGPIRWSFLKDTYIACSDFFSRNGWSPLGPDNADQPCIRVNSRNPSGIPSTFNLDRCVCEGGYQVVTIEGHDLSITEYPGNYLIDRALLIATSKTFKSFITAEYGGTTIRNTIGIATNSPSYHPNGWIGPVVVESQVPAPGNLDAPMQLYGNSFINLRDAANDPGDNWPVVSEFAAFTNTTYENNIAHGPGLDTPVNAGSFDMSATIPGVTPRYKGVLYNEFGQEDGTFNGTVGNGGSFTLPYPSGTNQSYWQAIEGTDTLHRLNADGQAYHSELGHFAISHEGSGVRVTNLSGNSWSSGASWSLKLDRKSQKSQIPDTHGFTNALPLPRPQSAIGTGFGLIPYDDFFGNMRSGNSAGALEP